MDPHEDAYPNKQDFSPTQRFRVLFGVTYSVGPGICGGGNYEVKVLFGGPYNKAYRILGAI